MLFRVGVGVGEAGLSPPAHSLISDYFEPQKRASALSIYSFGIPLGTMFGAVASRVGESGTLRALGFRRSAVLAAFLGESLLLSLLGGVAGVTAALAMQAVDVSTTNFATFAELAFQFRMTPVIAVQSMLFALLMGFVGGFVPAWRAARMNPVDALRAE